jgi:hypothetical protein
MEDNGLWVAFAELLALLGSVVGDRRLVGVIGAAGTPENE